MSSIPALVTPFTAEGSVDYNAFADLIEWQIGEGSDAILIHGTTGESPTITESEFVSLIRVAKGVIGKRLPLIVGTGTNSTRTSIEKTATAKELGADMALVIVPYYNLPSDEGCYLHFQEISRQTSLPLILYYHPTRTGKKLSIDTLVSFLSIPNVYAIKDSSSVETMRAILEREPTAKIYSGIDESTIPALINGAVGTISVVANAFPALWKQMVLERSTVISQLLEPVIKAIFTEVNPVGIKALLDAMGKCLPDVRLPLTTMRAENRTVLIEAINDLGSRCMVF